MKRIKDFTQDQEEEEEDAKKKINWSYLKQFMNYINTQKECKKKPLIQERQLWETCVTKLMLK